MPETEQQVLTLKNEKENKTKLPKKQAFLGCLEELNKKSMEEVNGYKLQPEVYWYGTRLVKIYSPIMVLDNEQYFWVYYLDDKDVTVVNVNKLKLANDKVQILYGAEND